MTATPDATAKPVTVQLREIVDRGEVALPPVPEVAIRILELLKDDSHADAVTVAELLRKDPALTATVLRMANSAMFGGLTTIGDVSLAVARLGIKRVASIVTALMHQNNFRVADSSRGAYLNTLWDHSLATAICARRLAGLTGGDPEEAFLAGLLHDVGKLLVLKGVEHLELGEISVTPELFRELTVSLHPDLGHRILTAWSLPEGIAGVALHHHDEEIDSDNLLLAQIQAANAIVHHLHGPQGGGVAVDSDAVDRLDLDDLELAGLLVDLEDELAEIRKAL